ncbi:unnamed protein product [Rotaria socialis]
MNNSTVSILDLPDEILLNIFKTLNNMDLLYSLFGINKRLDNMVCDINLTRSINLMMLPSNRVIDWRTSTIRDRIFMQLLPRIHNNVECLTVQGCFFLRVLLAGNYLNLRKLTLINLEFTMACHIFNGKLPYGSMSKK